ncbi:MAG: cohesin domain-containing protein [Candidatus Polarisedimenticolia bacterium]
MKLFARLNRDAAAALIGGALLLASQTPAWAAALSLPPDAGGRGGVTVSVPLRVDDAAGIRSADVRVEFSPAIAEAVAVSLTPLTSSFQIAVNLNTPGVVIVSMFGTTPLSGTGDLLRIDFQVEGGLGQSTSLDLVLGELNEGAIASTLQDGIFTVLPTYLLSMKSVNSGGGEAASASWRAGGSMGQESVVEASAAFGHVVQSGFWSFAGTGVVPVVLSVGATVLSWSGNDPPYSIYRSGDCSDVGSSLLTVTPASSFSDPAVPAPGQVFCYQVEPAPPGM